MSQIGFLRYGFAGDPALDTSKRAPLELTSTQQTNTEPSAPGPGVPMSPIRTMSITPLAIVANNIAASQIMNGAVTLTAGTSASSVTLPNGNTAIDICGANFDRAITITGAASGTAVTFTIIGYDQYFQPTSETITGPTTATVTSAKCYRYIQSISTSGTTTSAFTIGTADVFGFSVMVATFDQLVGFYYNNVYLTASTGFTAADQTSPATRTTGHVRGKYATQSATDGVKKLTAYIHLTPTGQNNMNLAYGVIPA